MPIGRERRGAVQVLVLDRPEALNVFTPEMIQDLTGALGEAARDPAVRAVVLTGAGRAVSAGADITHMAALDMDGARAFAAQGHGLCDTIENLPVPVIAAINGFALGGGCEVALACDIRLASEAMTIALPEVSLGIPPGWGGTQRLPRICGQGFAKRMILTAGMVGPEEALRAGLVTSVHAPDDLLDAAFAVGDEIATRSPAAVSRAKELINGALGDPSPSLAHEAEAFARQFDHPERREGMAAFLGKRPPGWVSP